MILLNLVLYQAGWFACVIGAAVGAPWIAIVAACLILAWHLSRAKRPMREVALVAFAAVLGGMFETLLVQTTWVSYEIGQPIAGAAPYWMVALWAIFATTLNVSLRFLRFRLLLAAVLAAAGGPVAYYAGARLGALELSPVGTALVTIAIGWSILAPVLLSTARKLDGYARA